MKISELLAALGDDIKDKDFEIYISVPLDGYFIMERPNTVSTAENFVLLQYRPSEPSKEKAKVSPK
jgi:hypothetical protein